MVFHCYIRWQIENSGWHGNGSNAFQDDGKDISHEELNYVENSLNKLTVIVNCQHS